MREIIELLFDEVENLKGTIALLAPPCWETPEQRKKRTGKAWPDDWSVYYRFAYMHKTCAGSYELFLGDWLVGVHRHIVSNHKDAQKERIGKYQWVCATEAGPPPDDWRPDETGNDV
jgi:hypothetical protein